MCTGKRGFFLSSRGEKIALGSCGSHRCKGRVDELKWLGSVSIGCLLDFTVQPQEVNSLPFHVLVYTVKIISFFSYGVKKESFPLPGQSLPKQRFVY